MNNRWRQIEKIRKRALIREKRLERMNRIIINEPKLQAILSAKHMCPDEVSNALWYKLINERMRVMYRGGKNE